MAGKGVYKWFPIFDFTGGRNAADDPLSIADNQVVQMRNGDTYRTRLFRKRGGTATPSIGSVFTGIISSLIAHFPNNNPAAAELWGMDDAATPIIGRMAAASTFSAPTLTDNPASGAGPKMRGVSYNGKLFLQYDSAVDRSHVYDPTLASPSVRRVGLAVSSAPTAANDGGAGTYAPVGRYYRQRTRIKNSTIVVAQSEPSAASAKFTPNGNDTGVTVTQGTPPSESETHWVIEGSSDNITFYELGEVVIGTTTYLDQQTVSSYSSEDLSPVLGAYIPPKSYKYVVAAFNRILWMGTWETGAGNFQSSVYYTPAKGTNDKGDDERVPDTLFTRYRLDLGEGTGGDGTGFAGPMYGSVFVFKYNAIKKMIPTGLASPVWEVIDVSTTRGAIEQECIAVGEDAQGRPAIFFLDAQVGPCMVGPVPPTEIGEGVRDLWDTVNLAATTKAGWVLDYPNKNEVWFAWATGSANDPNVIAIYNKKSGAWSVLDTGGKIRLSRAAVLFADSLGATMSRDKVPYTGYVSTANTLLRGDTADLDDSATTYQAIVKTRPLNFNGGQPFRVTKPLIIAKPASGVTLTVTIDADFGRETMAKTIDLTLTATEAAQSPTPTRVLRYVEGVDLSGVTWLQVQVGDSAAIANSWQIERIYVQAMPEEAAV